MKLRRKPEQPRRQRLSQSEPAKVAGFAYTSARQPQPERLSRQDLAQQSKLAAKWPALLLFQRAGLLVTLVAAALLAIDFLSLSPSVKVVPLNVAGSQSYLRPKSVYAAAADAILKSSLWNRSKVTVDTAALSQQLTQKFPELTSVSVTVPLVSHQPVVYLQAAQPALVLNTATGTFVIGTSGKALTLLSSSSSGPAGLPYLIDQSGLQFKLRQQALPASDVRFIQVIVAELAAKKYSVANLTLPAASSEVDAHLEGQPYFVKFNLQDPDPAGEAGTFLATINSLKNQNITPGQYVDVRVDGRAYYK